MLEYLCRVEVNNRPGEFTPIPPIKVNASGINRQHERDQLTEHLQLLREVGHPTLPEWMPLHLNQCYRVIVSIYNCGIEPAVGGMWHSSSYLVREKWPRPLRPPH